MAQEGFNQTFELDVDQLLDKTFHTYRKSRTQNKYATYKWHPMNLINKHYTRNADQAYDLLNDLDVPKRIHQSRPNLVLNIGNEYLTINLMEELKSKYQVFNSVMAILI